MLHTTTWGEPTHQLLQNFLPKSNPQGLLELLTEIIPGRRFSHYYARCGDGYSAIMRVDWSQGGGGGSSEEEASGFERPDHLDSSFIELNVTLKPRSPRGRAASNVSVQPHLPLLQPRETLPTNNSANPIEVDLCITIVSKSNPPFPSEASRTSVISLHEHKMYFGCIEKFRVEAANGMNDVLPTTRYVADEDVPSPAASLAVAEEEEEEEAVATQTTTPATTAGKKPKAPSKEEESAPKMAKAKSSKKKKTDGKVKSSSSSDDDGAKKPAAKTGREGGSRLHKEEEESC